MFGFPIYDCVSDGALEPKVRKYIFLGYTNGVKGYELLCTKEDLPSFMFSRDVTFDESTLFQMRSERSIVEHDLDGVQK